MQLKQRVTLTNGLSGVIGWECLWLFKISSKVRTSGQFEFQEFHEPGK